ncbi:MAG TPA: outer membrane beta-barrel protein, partial [Sphingomicrobium sp.]|nr:outer membrane beta-barrel protein [Sphingomicrobium sp.]
MRKYLLAAVAAAVVASPAAARDGSGYIGIEGGLLWPRSQNGTFNATFTQSAQSPAAGTAAPAPGTGLVGALPTGLATAPGPIAGDARVRWKRGVDLDLIAGYDFGMFRLEGELGWKRSRLRGFSQDTAFGTGVDAALNPAGTTGTAFVFPLDDPDAFNLRSRVSVLSGMVNGLLDFGLSESMSAYVGGGFGRARVRQLGESDSAWAWQGIAGVSIPVGANLDLGLKYRYFRTGRLNFDTDPVAFAGSTRTVAVPNTGAGATGSTNVTFTRAAAITGDFNNRFSSHSLLASLIYNFGSPAAPP